NLAHDLGATINTGVNGEKLAITYSSPGDTASAAVGSYPITGTLANGTGLLSDYSPTRINGTLTVTLASGSAYILNTSVGSALTVTGNAIVNLPGMLVVDSSAANAINASGNAQISAAGGVLVAGGVSKSGNATVSTTGSPTTTSDPLAALPLPSVTGLTNYGAVQVAGNSSKTLCPGIYTSIQVSGNASVTLTCGTYIIEGGGLSVSGNANLSGSGVLIFNAGSSYNGTTDGGTFGGISLGGNGTINLSGPTSGPYAGVVIFQSRGNSRALSLGGNGAAGITSTVYAPAANVGLSGNATVKGTLVVATLTVTGNAGAFQLTDGANSDYAASTSNWISNGILTVTAEDDAGNGIDPNELNDVTAAMTYLNTALGSYGVNLSWAPDGASADVTIHFASTTPEGDASDGVLGYTTASNDVYIVTVGWNYYTGSDASAIGAGQYDFLTLATHELAHTVGLGESVDPSSVMYEYLAPGTVRRTFTDGNLSLIDTNADRFMKAAALPSPLTGAASGLAPGALPAVLMDSAGAFGWESALSGSSVSLMDGRVAATPGLDGGDGAPVGGTGNGPVAGGPGRNLMTGGFGLDHVAEDGAEHSALDQLFASGELDLLLQPASRSLASR
ncbi:MAG TPA: matrixin family metalloprotease, partial [Gemmataceae bacterium]|nr:matrixin family metalloprotease [Gemmataceae bacterium]